MKTNLLLLTIMLLILTNSCGILTPSAKPTIIDLSSEGETRVFKASDFSNSVKTIALSSSENDSILSINQIEIVGDQIFIFDDIQNMIFSFNQEGKLQNRFGSIIPQEDKIFTISSFTTDAKEKNVFVCTQGNQILQFSFSGNFISRIFTENLKFFECTKVMDGFICWIYPEIIGSSEGYSLVKIDTLGKIVDQWLKNSHEAEKGEMSQKGYIQNFQSFISFWEYNCDTIYQLSDSTKPIAKYVITISDDLELKIRKGAAVISDIAETQKFFYISVRTYYITHYYIYDKNKMKLFQLPDIVKGFDFVNDLNENELQVFQVDHFCCNWLVDSRWTLDSDKEVRLKLPVLNMMQVQ